MKYYEEIEKRLNKSFAYKNKIIKVDSFSDEDDLYRRESEKLYKVNVATIAVSIVDFSSIEKNTERETLVRIVSEFNFGIQKIFKTFRKPLTITINKDYAYASYAINTRADVDNLFSLMTAINSFGKFIDSIRLDNDLILRNGIAYREVDFQLGIGASFSDENFLSINPPEVKNKFNVIGSSVDCAIELSKIANRDARGPILIDGPIMENITDELKEFINYGGIWKVPSIKCKCGKDIYDCTWT